MIERPHLTDPFRLSAHLEDDHDHDPNLAQYMDSEALRGVHEWLHARNIAFLPHFHTVSNHF